MLGNQVYKYVRDRILTGQLAPGEKIIETRLAADLQVSRSPVREAVRQLTAEQLLCEQDGAFSVFQPSVEDFYELYDLRLALEPILARRASESVTANQLLVLEKNLEATAVCLDSRSMEQLLYLNAEFHQYIWDISGNPRFIHILHTTAALIHYYCLLVLNINNQQTNILGEHTAIYQALKEGCPTRAEQSMYDHIMKDLQVVKLHDEGQAK